MLNLRQRCAECAKPLYMGEAWHEVPDAKFTCQACYDILTGATAHRSAIPVWNVLNAGSARNASRASSDS